MSKAKKYNYNMQKQMYFNSNHTSVFCFCFSKWNSKLKPEFPWKFLLICLFTGVEWASQSVAEEIDDLWLRWSHRNTHNNERGRMRITRVFGKTLPCLWVAASQVPCDVWKNGISCTHTCHRPGLTTTFQKWPHRRTPTWLKLPIHHWHQLKWTEIIYLHFIKIKSRKRG